MVCHDPLSLQSAPTGSCYHQPLGCWQLPIGPETLWWCSIYTDMSPPQVTTESYVASWPRCDLGHKILFIFCLLILCLQHLSCSAKCAQLESLSSFNVFEVARLTCGRPLEAVVMALLHRYNLCEKLALPVPKVKAFLRVRMLPSTKPSFFAWDVAHINC